MKQTNPVPDKHTVTPCIRSRYKNRINFVREQRCNLSRNKRNSLIQSSFSIYILYACTHYTLSACAVRHKDASVRVTNTPGATKFHNNGDSTQKRNYTIHRRLTPKSVIFMLALSKKRRKSEKNVRKAEQPFNFIVHITCKSVCVWIFVL